MILNVDTISVGMACGLNNTKVPLMSRMIIFVLTVIYTSIAVIIGIRLENILPESLIKIIGSLILFCIGINMIFKSVKDGKKNGRVESDIDNSGVIDIKEAILLTITLSIDAFSTGIASASIEIGGFLFPIFNGIFQLTFLILGMQIGRYFIGKSRIEERNMTTISGIILIIFSIAKLI